MPAADPSGEDADALLPTQRDRLIALGVATLAGLTDTAFAALVRRLLPVPLSAPTPERDPSAPPHLPAAGPTS